MYLETKEIGPDGLAIDRRIDFTLPAPPGGEEPIRVGTVHLRGELFREAGGVSFTGTIATLASLVCSRCIEWFDLPLDLQFNLRYLAGRGEPEAPEAGVDEETVALTPFDGQRIDLGEMLSEQIYLGLPLKPLCRADCRGLCARCGANLNLEACGCGEKPSGDPRLLRLKTLL